MTRCCRRTRVQVTLWAGIIVFTLRFEAQILSANDHQIKAAYLYNFAKLTEWPKQVLPDDVPLVICVIGDESFIDILRATVAGKIIGTHAISVRDVASGNELKSCNLIFFHGLETKRTLDLLPQLSAASILLVGEDKDFLQQGGMLNFVLRNGAIRFEVNAEAWETGELHISSKLLAQSKSEEGLPGTESQGRLVLVKIYPTYPELAQRMNLKGIAQVKAVVRRDGTIKKIEIVGGHPVLAKALAQAVQQWKYKAASQESVVLVKYDFGESK